jgi:hypothetical protein
VTAPTPAELARRTRQIHRERFWGGVRYRSGRPFMRLLCLVRRHAHWSGETMLAALASGRSRRCRWCSRLVLKPQYRSAL